MTRNQTLFLIILLLLVLVSFSVFAIRETAPEPQTSSIATKECEVGQVNPDGTITITEPSAGEYGYTIYTTSDGIKVMGKCD